MRDTFLIFGSPVIGEAEIAGVVDSLRSGSVGTGPKVQRFEQLLADYVRVPAMTFVASANAVEHAGATPVRYDELLAGLPLSHHTISLPLSPKVTDADQDDVVAALTELLA